MMDALGCRVIFEGFDKCLILDEELLQEGMQVGFLDGGSDPKEFLVHGVNVIAAAWHVVCRNILSITGPADTAYIELKAALIGGHAALHLDKIQCFKMLDPRVQVPDLGVKGAGLILQGQVLIIFPCFGLEFPFFFTKINLRYHVIGPELADIMHICFLF